MKELIHAEKRMGSNPHSSLAILKALEKNIGESRLSETLSEKQYALWCLLLTQAQDKNGITQASDSLIRIAVDYFDKKKDKPRLMKAYYYLASICHNMGDVPQAQESYQKARDLAETLNDHAILGQVYANLGSMYTHQNLTDEAKACQEKALSYFLITKDSVNIGIARRNIGQIQAKNGEWERAINSYFKAAPFLIRQHRASIYNEMALLYGRLKQYPKAFEYIRLTMASLTEDNDRHSIYHNVGDLYRQTGSYDSAHHYLYLALASPNIYTRSGANLSLSFLEEKQGNYQASFKYLERRLHLQDSISKAEQDKDLESLEKLYRCNQVRKERNFYEQEVNKKTAYIQLSVLFIAASIAISIVLYLYSTRLKKENKEKTLRLEEIKLQIEKQPKIAGEDKRVNALKADPLCQKIITNKAKATDADWEALTGKIEEIYPGFTYNLKMLYPEIKEKDLRVC
ncbi:MAG: tetratricopeptide repeat protein, partial [Tannerellaceae bacterium]|nr:tetratricopeptide repeat protein [Tannerellaceae bacterium]